MPGLSRGFAALAAGALAALAPAASPALADDVPVPPDPIRPAANVDFWWENRAFDDFMFDTGWIPSGSDVQVRFALTVLGRTEVGLGGTCETSWPQPLTVRVPGRPLTGWLSIGYGMFIVADLRVDVTILGEDVFYEGPLPFLDLPSDLLLASDLAFDPFVLPGADPNPVAVSDTTERVRALTYDVAGAIGIPGVEGSISLDVQALLEAQYHTDRIDVGDTAPIELEGGTTLIPQPDPAGYGRSVDYEVLPEGIVDYLGGAILYPHVTVAVLGFTVIDEDLAMIPVSFDLTSVSSEFDPAAVHVPLPDLALTPAALTISAAAPGTVTFHSSGEADGFVQAIDWPAPLLGGPPALVVPAGQARSVGIATSSTQAATVVVTFSTNDPDRPTLTVPVTILAGGGGGNGDAGPGADPGPGDAAAGCDCRAGRPDTASTGGLAAALALLILVRRRRAR